MLKAGRLILILYSTMPPNHYGGQPVYGSWSKTYTCAAGEEWYRKP